MSYDDLPILDYGARGIVTVAANAEGVANLAVQAFSTALTSAWANRGAAAIALSGGSTPKRLGELLAHSDFPVPEAWEHLDIFWGDERWVPLDNPESNAGIALDTFLTKVPIPADNVHPLYEEGLDEAQAAAIYQALIEEIAPHAALGYKAVKLRVADRTDRDIARVAAVRKAYGDGLTILVDANTGYSVEDVRRVMPVYEELGVGWLEEPFSPSDHSS